MHPSARVERNWATGLVLLTTIALACADTVETRYVDIPAAAGGTSAAAKPTRLVATFPYFPSTDRASLSAIGTTLYYQTIDEHSGRSSVQSVTFSGSQKVVVADTPRVYSICPSADGVYFAQNAGSGASTLISRAGSDVHLPFADALACSFRGGHGILVVTPTSGGPQTLLVSGDLANPAPRVLIAGHAQAALMTATHALAWKDGELRAFPVAGGDALSFGPTSSCFGVHEGRVVWPGATSIESRVLPGEPINATSLEDGCVKVDADGAWYVNKERQSVLVWRTGAGQPVEVISHQLGIDKVFVDEKRLYWNTIGDVWALDKP